MNFKALGMAASLFLAAIAFESNAQQNVSLSLKQTEVLAQKALAEGNLPLAEQLSVAIIRGDQTNTTALLVLAAVNSRSGRHDTAFDLARLAYRSADGDREKYPAARLAAQSLLAQKKEERAKIWLRRAVQAAPSPAAKKQTQQLFQRVRASSPWRTNLQFGFAPNSNVNNGTENETIDIFGLPFTLNNSEPLSGYFLTGLIGTSYRVAQTSRSRTSVGLDIYHREVLLSSSAKELTELEGSDFNYTFLGLKMLHEWAIGENGTRANYQYQLAQTWYGGERLAKRAVLNFGLSHRINDQSSGRVNFGVAREINLTAAAKNFDQQTLSYTYSRRLGNGSTLQFVPSISNTDSDSSTVANNRYRLGINYTPGQPIFGVNSSFQFGLGKREDKYITGFASKIREDEEVSLKASFNLPDLDWFGFTPFFILEAKRTTSNIELYDTKSIGGWIEIRSSF